MTDTKNRERGHIKKRTRRDFLGIIGRGIPTISVLSLVRPKPPIALAGEGGFETGVSYFGTRDPDHVRRDIEEMVKKNCTFVVHTLSEADYHFYSRAMEEVVKISHDAGLSVYIDPWGVGGVFGGEAFSLFVMKNPGECQRLADGTRLPAACLNSSLFRDFMVKWVGRATDIGSDVLFWDEPHFYIPRAVWRGNQREDEWACRCDVCKNLFSERFGREMPMTMDSDVIDFRDRSIADFFSELTGLGAKMGLKNAVVMLPDESHLTGVSSWDVIASLDTVDIFGTDPYWYIFKRPLDDFVRGSTKKVAQICDKYNKEPQMWVQAYKVPVGREEEIFRAIEIIAEEGVKNIAAWSYKGGAYMDLMSEDYLKVWDILGRAYGKLNERTG